MIDTHVHFWKYNKARDTWMEPDIRRDFLPEDIKSFLKESEVEGLVAVQADQSEAENRFLLDLAKKNPILKGIVGWIDLLSNDLERCLTRYETKPLIKGWRHIVQAEPPGFLEQSQFIKNVETIGKAGYTYGILIYHHQFPEALKFVKQLPEQPLALNHLGKPDLRNFEYKEWQKNMRKLAEHPNVFCKLSGLVTEADKRQWTVEMIHTYLDIAIETFDTNRVMIGSDWPVMLLKTDYSEWINILKDYLKPFSETERAQIVRKNAINFYNLKI